MRLTALLCLALTSLSADTLVRGLPEIKVAPVTPKKAWAFELTRVRLLDGPFKRAMESNGKWLLAIEPDRLLSRFRQFSGLEPKGKEYPGWESATISGHSLGHYLSAVALMYASTGDTRYLERVNYIVDELALAQAKRGSGFVGGFPHQDRLFGELAQGVIKSQPFDLNGIWVPWYTQHKLFQGLLDAHTVAKNQKARDVAVKLADFMLELSNKLNDEQMQQMLATEHGGLLESFTDMYALTGDEKYLKLAARWVHKRFMDPLAAEKDNLTGLHGNTNIPKVIGAARHFEVTNKPEFQTIARFFWEKVVRERSYVNGGHGDNEYFFPPTEFNNHVSSHAAETCNTYNMLKLTRHLFSWNTSAEAADFYERALYNHILASQNPADGTMIYLCSFKPGHFKVYGTPFDSFWCCTGSGMENHAKYGDSIYFHDDNGLWVNLFIASELDWKEKGLKVRQETRYPEEPVTRLTFDGARAATAELRIRHPWWAASALKVRVNGRAVSVTSKPGGYALVRRAWKKGDVLEITFPMRLYTESLPGVPDRIAMLYGPAVMAGALGREGMKPPMPVAKERLEYDLVATPDVPVIVAEDRNAGEWFKRVEGKPLAFTTARPGVLQAAAGARTEGVELLPFYAIHDQRYTVYWNAFSSEGWKKSEAAYRERQQREKALEARSIDIFRIGHMEPERDHNFRGQRSVLGEMGIFKYRDMPRGGQMTFDMKVEKDKPVELVCTYWGGHEGRSFEIFAGDVKLATQTLNKEKPDSFFDVTYALPEAVTQGKEKVTIRIQSPQGQPGAALFKAITLRRE